MSKPSGEFGEKKYNGQYVNFLYFKDGRPLRKANHAKQAKSWIAVAFVYNRNEGVGSYCAARWYQKYDGEKKLSWNKKLYREIARGRFEKCLPLGFHVKYNPDDRDKFDQEMENAILHSIRRCGLKGPRKPKNNVVVRPVTNNEAGAASSVSDLPPLVKRQRVGKYKLRNSTTRQSGNQKYNDALVEAMH